MTRAVTLLGALVIGTLSFAQSARAANIVVNGDFETGDITGWTDGGNTGWNSVCAGCGVAGSLGVSNGAAGSESILFQYLATDPGTYYDLSIFEQRDGGGYITIRWDGVTIDTSSASTSYVQLVFPGLLATTASTLLEIGSRDDPGFNEFDNIVVEGNAQVPEPATLLLLGTGLAEVVRRRRNAKRS